MIISSLAILISGILAYLIGALPTSFLFAKAITGADIRQLGSGNVGATNVLRTVGKLPALATLVIDIAKGAVVVTLLAGYAYRYIDTLEYDWYRAILGFIAIAGHVWPVFLGFRGGKGIATTIGVTAMLMPLPLLLAGALWLAVFAATQYVSLASIVLSVMVPVFAAALAQSLPVVVLAIAIAILTTYRHKDNIRRLLRHEEHKTVIFPR